MSYHRFINLRELFQADLSTKLTANVESKDFQTLKCNCRPGQSGGCSYDNICRKPIIVYQVKCKYTGKQYIGNTQQFFKNRMSQHFNEVRRLRKKGEASDSYAKHFAEILQNFKNPSPEIQRNGIESKVLWQGNPISAVKTFGSPICVLCNKERLAILKQSREKPNLLINSCSEIYGACRHKPRFHRYISARDSTDDSNRMKKSNKEK